MPLVENILTQLGEARWFFALDNQSRFWQIKWHEKTSASLHHQVWTIQLHSHAQVGI
jgi:hypothetical protein